MGKTKRVKTSLFRSRYLLHDLIDTDIPPPQDSYADNSTLSGSGVSGGHTSDFDGFSLPERRNHHGRDTLGLERESDFVVQVAMPAHGLLFRSISVHDNFILDSVLAEGISFALRHCHCGS